MPIPQPTTGQPTTFRPETVAELRAAILDSARAKPQLLIGGAGTASDWGGPPDPPDALINTTALTGVLHYNPADLTIAVRAGTPLAQVQDELAGHHQHIAFDAARTRRGATVGGLLATADAGPARQLHGALRDLVIGATVVLADGTVARCGGHVIKNVAGYDLTKLFHGSLGTLGVVAELVLRVHPRCRAERTLAVPSTAADAFALAGQVIGTGLEPTALEWLSGPAGNTEGRLLIRLDGTEDGVAQRRDALLALAGARARTLTDTERDQAWDEVAAVAEGAPGDTVLRAGTLPAHGPAWVDRVSRWAGDEGARAEVSSSGGVGVHTVALHGGAPGAHARVLAALHTEDRGPVTVRRRDGLAATTPVWGPPPGAIAVIRAVKQRFDPTGRFGAGRFTPWLDSADSTRHGAEVR